MGSNYDPLRSPEYVAGSLTISGGQIGAPQNLLDLIKVQLEANCRGAGLFINIEADDTNTSNVLVGCPTKIGGALSATNYGYSIIPGGQSYRNSSGGGISAPVAAIQVFSVDAAKIHIEIWS